jgi:DNA-binding response OmpR family regulator
MHNIPNIEFEIYRGGNVVSAVNTRKKLRIAKTPARILYMLLFTVDKFASKRDLCLKIWDRDDYFVRRSFDVHLSKVKKLLVGTGYVVHVEKQKLGVFKYELNNQEKTKTI